VGCITYLLTSDHMLTYAAQLRFNSKFTFVYPLECFAMDGRVWDLIRACGLSDLVDKTPCYGQTLAKRRCRNPISEKSRTAAVHLLELLAQRPADGSLLESLKKVARLLLCKRNHRHKEDEQVQPLAERWYESARASGAVRQHVSVNMCGIHAWQAGSLTTCCTQN
jgi:hypothetical protein